MVSNNYYNVDGTPFKACIVCGSLVVDTVFHDKWHEVLGQIATSARRADAWTRPIG